LDVPESSEREKKRKDVRLRIGPTLSSRTASSSRNADTDLVDENRRDRAQRRREGVEVEVGHDNVEGRVGICEDALIFHGTSAAEGGGCAAALAPSKPGRMHAVEC
jgi:hypothetical protein